MDVFQYCEDGYNPNEEEGISLLKCLCLALSDEEGKTLVRRHVVLMDNYMELRQNGIKSFDLPFLMSPLEFFSENSTDEEQYRRVILKCFKLLLKPILFHKASDACIAADNLPDFFSALGNCLIVAADYTVETTILDVILFLITHKAEKSEEMSLALRLEAVEYSFLPEIIVSFMYFITDELYQPLLEIMYQLSLQPAIDVGLLAFATEFGTANTWANRVSFKPTREDLDFKKILITILLITNEDPVTKMVLLVNRSINALAFILNMRDPQFPMKWNQNQRLELINCCLYALPIFSKHFKEEYTRSGATVRILELIEYFISKQQNLRLLKNCCLCLHLLISSGITLKHFRVLNVTEALISLIIYLLKFQKFSLLVQTIISYCFCAITNLVQDHVKSKEMLADDLFEVYSLILFKIERPIITDTKISNSLLISACDFTWQCIVLNVNTKDDFYDNLGVHSILNVMEEAPFLVQNHFLSLLGDLCQEPKSLPQIVTWRGKDRNSSFFKILCDLWRKQENIKGVLRDKHGCIEDIENSLMGRLQQERTEGENVSSSPSLVDVIACARPKIAIAVDLITRRHFEKVTLASSIYNIPFLSAISPEDQKSNLIINEEMIKSTKRFLTLKITLQIIQCYEELKYEEILREVQRAVNKVGVQLLPLDVEVLHKLIMRFIGLASKVQRSQRSILKTMRKKELEEEHKIYKEIEEYQLATAVEEYVAKDSYLTVSNKMYRKWIHKKYEDFLDSIEHLYADKRDQNFHQTFYHPRDFIVVKTGRDAQIISIKKKKEWTKLSYSVDKELEETPSEIQFFSNKQ